VSRGRLPAALTCLALVFAACGEEDEPDGRAACQLPLPRFPRDTVRGSVTANSGNPVSVGVAARDDTVTVVGFCLPNSRFPDPAPSLRDGGRVRHPIGGELQQTAAGWRNYYIYPASRSRRLTVDRGGRTLARVKFEREPQGRPCAYRTRRPFEVLACGAIVVVEWSSDLRMDADRLELLDVDALDGGPRGAPLNYYDLGYRDGPRGLRVRFGIRPPRTDRVVLRLNLAYVRSGNGVKELRLRDRVGFRLAR
jgi:hypothetical protein